MLEPPVPSHREKAVERSASKPSGHPSTHPLPGLGGAEEILTLQRSIGNRATLRILAQRAAQPQLEVSQPGDPLELEADRVASDVTQSGPRPAGTTVWASANGGGALPPADRGFMESRFGRDFSSVRVHADAQAAGSAEALNAKAYTLGADIVFGAGQYAPEMPEGRRLLAHELTHVVQQGGAPLLAKANDSQAPSVDAAAQIQAGAALAVARDSKTPIPFPRVQYSGPDGTFYRKFDGVTTYSFTSKERLVKAGYQFSRTEGGNDIWVKVDRSSEIWVQLPKPASPAAGGGQSGSGAQPNPQAPTNPDIQDARAWAVNLETRFNQLWDEAAKVKALKRPDGSYPYDPFNDYFKKLNRFDQDLKSVLDDEAPLWRAGSMSAEESKELEKQIARIKNVQEHPPEMELDE